MTKKTDPQDPGPVPGEKKLPRRLGLPLSEKSAALVRKVAAHTGIPIADVLAGLAGNEELERHIEKGCKRLAELNAQLREVERNMLFAPPTEGES